MLQASPFDSLCNSPVVSPRTSLLLKLTRPDLISHRLPPLTDLPRDSRTRVLTHLNTHALPYSYFSTLPVRPQSSKLGHHTHTAPHTGVLWGIPHGRSVQLREAQIELEMHRTQCT